MIDKKPLLRWLDTASIQELELKLIKLESIEIHLTDPDVVSEYNWIKRKLIEELDIRRQIGELGKYLTK